MESLVLFEPEGQTTTSFGVWKPYLRSAARQLGGAVDQEPAQSQEELKRHLLHDPGQVT